MKIKLSFSSSLEYIYSTVSLIVIFCLLSAIEVFKNFDIQLFAYKLVNDFSTGLIIGLLFFPLYLVLNYFKESLGIKVIKVLFTIIGIIQLGLIGYSLTTHINLGADILGYSASDMYTTVTASLEISFMTFLPFIVLPLVYFGLIRLFNSFGEKINTKFLLILVFVLGMVNFLIADNKPATKNKLNFLLTDIIKAKNDKASANDGKITFKKEFPLEKPADSTKDVLSPFFNIKDEKPNVVFIIMEGLGSDFMDDGEFKGCTPYLDALTKKSLYWENFVSNAGRTFGALPSLMGSLPFGENGFMEINPLPKHNSLISILKSNGYATTYYCGDDSNFDKKANFLEYDGIDKIIDINKFGPGYTKTKANSGGFSWGYPDAEIYRKTLSELKNDKPRLDIIMTLTNHEPFDFPGKDVYLKKVDAFLNTKSADEKSKMEEYKNIFACLMYTDNSLQKFMEDYAKRPDYGNTIFVITGDHRLIPVPQKDNLCRFHVPFYIYSPMLKKTAKFKSISSHRDVAPSLVAFLSDNYKINKPAKTAWLGNGLDTVKRFRGTQKIALMRYKGAISDYIYNDYFYSDGSINKIDENFNLNETDNNNLETVAVSFNDFKRLNVYLTSENKITNAATNFKKPDYAFTPEQISMIKKITKGLILDDVFQLARKLAFNNEHEKARLLCNYILNDIPTYGDVRTLKARTLAWDKNYKEAEKELLVVLDKTPFYTDGYSAIMDVYNWSDQNTKAIKIGKKALTNKIDNQEIGFKLAQAYNRNKNKDQSRKVIDSLIKIYPNNPEYISFKKSL
jgi:phosphoglycerol transferase MdoB-like AlkP superfamily enzyme